MTDQLPDEGLSLPNRHRARAIREAAGWSRQRMADQLGVHLNSVIRWELGLTVPGGWRLWAYAELLRQLGVPSQREAAG